MKAVTPMKAVRRRVTPMRIVATILRNGNRGARTNAQGQFTLGDIPPETYEVWFRRLGYESAQYTWSARSGARTEVVVTLHMLPYSLDPVVVRAREETNVKGSSTLLGMVIDSLGQAVEEAEVQLVGADRTAVTLAKVDFSSERCPWDRTWCVCESSAMHPTCSTSSCRTPRNAR
jgi:hypothetical protein